MVPARAESVARGLSGLALLAAIAAAAWLLLPRPLADAFFAGWVALSVVLAAVGVVGTWTGRRPLVWGSAGLLVALAIVGMWSIGLFVAPAALLLLTAAVVLQASGGTATPPEERPSTRAALVRALAGGVVAAAGGWLAYEGTVVRELFGRGCAMETVDCALAVTNWDGVGLTLLGLAAVGAGSWLVWRQRSIRSALEREQPG